MAITAERMLFALDLAEQAVEKVTFGKEKFGEMSQDLSAVQRRLNKLKVNDEELDDLIFSLSRTSRDCILEMSLPPQALQNLGSELTWFKMNQSKHRSSRERMQMLRRGVRQNEFKPRRKREKTLNEWEIQQMMQDELDKRERIGKERHEDKGPCNGDLDGRCSWCEEIEKRKELYQKSFWTEGEKPGLINTDEGPTPLISKDEVISPETKELYGQKQFPASLGQDQEKPAAFSEHIPTLDHESWKPKTKKEE